MTLEEVIKHCEEVADQLEGKDGYAYTDSTCDECAKEHRQLAEWLMELQAWRRLGELFNGLLTKEQIKKLKEKRRDDT